MENKVHILCVVPKAYKYTLKFLSTFEADVVTINPPRSGVK